jgi:hypothetical protein
MNWQPISTAPKDGTTVFLYCDDYVPYAVGVGSWEDDEWIIDGAGWVPTHWMPVPKLAE